MTNNTVEDLLQRAALSERYPAQGQNRVVGRWRGHPVCAERKRPVEECKKAESIVSDASAAGVDTRAASISDWLSVAEGRRHRLVPDAVSAIKQDQRRILADEARVQDRAALSTGKTMVG